VDDVHHLPATGDPFFLGAVTGCKGDEEPWNVYLKLCDKVVTFKIDTGADTSVISEDTFRKLNSPGPLEKAEPLFGPGGGRLQCLGKFSAETTHKDIHYSFPVHVIRGNSHLLGISTASTMGLILKVNNVQSNIPVFGKFGLVKCEPVKITLKRDCKPHCLTTARRVAFPLMPKVEAEIHRLGSESGETH
jgi:hypothetical protein